MSAYLTTLTPMSDLTCLLAALADMGFSASKVEVHAAPVPLVGYRGDARIQTANVVLRRQHVGQASNDIGFLATPTGYKAIVSDYDQSRYGAAWLGQLNQQYQAQWSALQARRAEEERRRAEEERQRLVETQRQAVHERAKKLGYRVQESREGDAIRLILVKRTY